MKHTLIWVAAMLLIVSSPVYAAKKGSKKLKDQQAELKADLSKGQLVRCIAFYNLENLFDTIHDEGKNDYEYLPDGGMKWTSLKYENKVKNMAYAVSQDRKSVV